MVWAAGASGRFLAGSGVLVLMLSGCGGSAGGGAGGAGSVVLPPPPPAPAPAPAPAPLVAPAMDFGTAEISRSNAAVAARAVAAWQAGASGAGILAAVIDSGVNPGLLEFSGRISPLSRDLAGTRGMADEDGHGTSVTGVLLAARDDAGVAGVAWGATLLALRVDTPGSCAAADGCRYSSNAIAQGLDVATQAGARVVNLSLGGSGISAALRTAAERAGAAGVVTVVSAGNDGSSEIGGFAAGLLQAAPSTTLVVGALEADGQMAGFSNRAGVAADRYLTALGVRVRSFDASGTARFYSGTSAAAPVVSGAVALMADAFPALSGGQIAEILLKTADDLGAPGVDAVFGRGQLNIERAFQPVGGLSITGVAAPIAVAGGSLGPAMGDLGVVGAALGRVQGRDAYGRDFVQDLGVGLRLAAPGRLAAALFSAGSDVAAMGFGPVSMRFSASDNGRRDWFGDRLTGAQPLAGGLALGGGLPAPVGHVRLALGRQRAAVLGFGQRVETLLAIAGDGAGRPEMLVAGQGGLMMQPRGGAAMVQRLGNWSASLAMGEAMLPAGRLDGGAVERTALLRLGRDIGPLALAATLRLADERGSVLGARLAPVFGVQGSSQMGLGVEAGWQRGRLRLTGGAEVRRVVADVRGGALLAGFGGMGATSAWAGVEWQGAGDRLSFVVAQPERAFGQADVRLGGAVAERLRLTPRGREIAAELGWARPLAGGLLRLDGFVRRQPGHVANAGGDVGAAVRFSLRH